MIRSRMSADEATHAPVINNVVDILAVALGFGIAALAVDPEVMGVGDISHGIGKRAEALRIHTLANDAVLKSDFAAALCEPEAIPAPPLDAAMIKNHVTATGKIDGAFA